MLAKTIIRPALNKLNPSVCKGLLTVGTDGIYGNGAGTEELVC